MEVLYVKMMSLTWFRDGRWMDVKLT